MGESCSWGFNLLPRKDRKLWKKVMKISGSEGAIIHNSSILTMITLIVSPDMMSLKKSMM